MVAARNEIRKKRIGFDRMRWQGRGRVEFLPNDKDIHAVAGLIDPLAVIESCISNAPVR